MAWTAPQSAKARYNLGVTLQDRGEPEAALIQFRRALEIYPWYEDAALRIGIGFEQVGRADAALTWYGKALEIAPDLGAGHTNLCRLLLLEERFDDAAVACRRGLRYAPSDANLLKALGESLIGRGEMQKGIAVLRRSLALNQQDQALRIRIAERESNTGHETGTAP
jgi:tetratricopeptide (TPR) repeat protein